MFHNDAACPKTLHFFFIIYVLQFNFILFIRELQYLRLPLFVRQAVEWLKGIQLKDGGFSESPETYVEQCYLPYPESVPSQTAWALMGLMAAGEKSSDSVKRGIDYLVGAQRPDGSWDEKYFTGTGFPGHFYIRYHGYRHFFPLMALANYNK